MSERNPRVVSAVKLHRSASRRKTGLFLAEGANSVAAALDTERVEELFYSNRAAEREHELVATAAALGVRTTLVSERAAEHLGETVTPPGLVAVCRLVDVPLSQVVSPRHEDAPAAADGVPGLAAGGRLLAVPVEIADPGNAGTLIRVADAVGADGVVLAGDSVDPHNGKCVRACAGSLFHVPIARDRDIDAVLNALRDNDITVLATTARGEVDLDDADDLLRTAGESGGTAWLFGNEAHGLDPAVAARADHRIRIPIHGRAESLNLAAAAAICLYADARVRHR
ncbi:MULTISPECIES: RNA methyltransferase [Nocardia]|uniref:TrmH family RNA methyltransferase n=1 Tax=Nocardia TaxID=1817 RepID=UPI0007EBCFA6|nr:MULTISPECIES: RNA methyltransferase [Nocardia]MBF6274484.1 RNA methyltransferase [Nocardia nova]OBA49210.1 RNA methyltransferase [Nocardia sp. 852002-51101_SCH5132738]OBB42280.1 RNA methyltransferase [Nocardia sp. 852002-51244_SCH5132740]OBF65289.1 RNA methyltransferase [Mycobacterium sp. 852002-51759_SCH5129042]